jgi:hypothetical protein
MLLGRGTRRAIGIVMLLAFAGPLFFLLPAGLRESIANILYPARWPLAVLAAIVLASAIHQIWTQPKAAPPKAKPRPTHLRVVRNDETLH